MAYIGWSSRLVIASLQAGFRDFLFLKMAFLTILARLGGQLTSYFNLNQDQPTILVPSMFNIITIK